MSRRPLLASLLVFIVASASVEAQSYVVADAVGEKPWTGVARALARHRRGRVIPLDLEDIASFRRQLVQRPPRYVAVVIRPDQLDFNVARTFLEMSTRLDEDPFVDFSFGFITGADAKEAMTFVKRSISASRRKLEPSLARMVGTTSARSTRSTRNHPVFRRRSIPTVSGHVAGGEAFGKGDRDREFMKEFLPELRKHSLVMFIGHGLPWEVAHGPDYETLTRLSLAPSVVLNVACYTGTTHTWYESSFRPKVERKTIPLERSFALGVLRAGALGYVAYTCPRPAGPELDCDLSEIVCRGSSLGDARRRDYDKTVLGFLGFGEDRMVLPPLVPGAPIPRGGDVVREVMLEDAAGGILFGDPALRPFRPQPGEAPMLVEYRRAAGEVAVHVDVDARSLLLQTNDPTSQWGSGRSMAQKVHVRVPLEKRWIRDVVVDELTVGGRALETRVVWALEVDEARHFAQVKVNFPRQKEFGALEARLRVLTTEDQKAARAIGGERKKARRGGKAVDPLSRDLTPEMIDLACRNEVPEAALQAALDATVATYPGAKLDARKARATLRTHGRKGYRALCVLIELGRTHYRTHVLLEDTWQPGEEKRLLALAARDLPGYAEVNAIEGLRASDTPAVRRWLLQKLEATDDAGVFLGAARATSGLRELKAAPVIAARLLECRSGWSGVNPILVGVLHRLRGDASLETIAKWILDQRATQVQNAFALLERRSQDRARRVARALVAQKKRFGNFPEPFRKRLQALAP